MCIKYQIVNEGILKSISQAYILSFNAYILVVGK